MKLRLESVHVLSVCGYCGYCVFVCLIYNTTPQAGNENHLYVISTTNLMFTSKSSILLLLPLYEVDVQRRPYRVQHVLLTLYLSTTPASRTRLEFDT